MPYQRLLATILSVFYGILLIIGVCQLPAVFATYLHSHIGEALAGYVCAILALYFLSLFGIYWKEDK